MYIFRITLKMVAYTVLTGVLSLEKTTLKKIQIVSS